MHGWIAYSHTLAAMLALLVGAFIFPRIKGTRLHKVLGYTYAAAMLATTFTAFCIYHLTGRFGVFHVAATISFLTLIAALVPVITRRPAGSWLKLHYKYTAWSYIGLVAAALSEAAVRLPRTPFWPAVAIGSGIVFGGGGFVVARLQGRTLGRVRNRALRPLF